MVKRVWVNQVLWLTVLGIAACSSEETEERICPGACDSPPEAYCRTASTLRTYAAEGTCVQGQCKYDSDDEDCDGPCVAAVEAGEPAHCAPAPADAGGEDGQGEPTPDLGPVEDAGAEPAPDAGPEPTPEPAPDLGLDAGPEPTPDMDPCFGVVCNTPPEPICDDADTVKSFDLPGVCVGGECQWVETDTECADLALDPVCADPPAAAVRTYDGTCSGGACTFTDTPCDSPPNCFVFPAGCSAGECTYSPKVCDQPPPDECVVGPAARHYDPTGTCDPPDDMCDYGYVDEGCLAPPNATPNCTGEGECGYTCDLPYYACEDGTVCCDDWQPMETAGAPTGRERHTAVWNQGLGNMMVWGGSAGVGPLYFSTGAAYSPGADAWTPLPSGGAPSPRALHTAIWTGNRMVIWGGRDTTTQRGDGARYNVSGSQWAAISMTDAPSGRSLHRAVWAVDLDEMIVWGGTDGIELADGARYDPVLDVWTAFVDTTDPHLPSPRSNHSAVYTGLEMIVWGGAEATAKLDDGARYIPTEADFPTGDPWVPMSDVDAPVAREGHTAVWTGIVMLLWGGGGDTGLLDDGAAYDPVGDAWAPLSTTDAPSPRWRHTAVWTGTHMIVWGGEGPTGALDTGAAYDPVGDTWTPLPVSEVATARYNHSAVWTGTEMLVWGGTDAASEQLDTGARLTPP